MVLWKCLICQRPWSGVPLRCWTPRERLILRDFHEMSRASIKQKKICSEHYPSTFIIKKKIRFATRSQHTQSFFHTVPFVKATSCEDLCQPVAAVERWKQNIYSKFNVCWAVTDHKTQSDLLHIIIGRSFSLTEAFLSPWATVHSSPRVIDRHWDVLGCTYLGKTCQTNTIMITAALTRVDIIGPKAGKSQKGH